MKKRVRIALFVVVVLLLFSQLVLLNKKIGVLEEEKNSAQSTLKTEVKNRLEVLKDKEELESNFQQTVEEKDNKIKDQEKTIIKLKKENQELKKSVQQPTRGGTGKTTNFVATAYCGCRICNGKWTGYPTASQTDYVEGRTMAVDPEVIPLGTKVKIEGLGYRVAEDTGGAIKGNRVDIYFDSHSKALEFGRRNVRIEIVGSV